MLIVADTTSAAGAQAHEEIRQAAQTHALREAQRYAPAGGQIKALADRIDPRLLLGACDGPLETFTPAGQSAIERLNVGVKCESPAWSLFLPVRVEILADVVILSGSVARGQALSRDQLRLDERDVAPLIGGYLSRIEDAEHMTLKRSVPLGTILTTSLIERPKLIERGQRVQVIAGAAALTITTYGEALADAAEGDRVKVRNLKSLKVVEGKVDADGRVRVGGPV
jgi:flagella basal body P-ring formation protein FlgA